LSLLYLFSAWTMRYGPSIDLHKELEFTLKKSRSRRHPVTMLTDVDYADDIALFADNLGDAERLLHLLEVSAANIRLHGLHWITQLLIRPL